MSTKNKKKVKDELFLDALSDCSEDSDMEDMETSDDESDDNNSESEDDINSLCDMDWSEIDDIRPKLEDYDRTSGVNTIPQDQQNVLKFVQLFIGDDLFALFASETNRYRSQVANELQQNRAVKWVDVTVMEMKKFLGLIILMGQVHKDDVYDYWSTLSYIETPAFTKTMSRNRFLQIWTMWHFCNNELLDKSDKLFKIREVLNYLQHKFQTVYTPKQELILDDECIIPPNGRSGLRFRYNPSKLVKNGFLVRLLCEARSGYICNFEVYPDREAMSQDILLPILDPFVGFQHHIYMNNYCNSVETAEYLLQKNTRICGPIRPNGLTQRLRNIRLKEHETKFARKGEVLLHVWQAKKIQTVRTISTIHSAEMINVSCGSGVKSKPRCVLEYNTYMKGIDRADQYMPYYNILRKSTKWAKKAVVYFLNAALFNSFQVYRKINNDKMTYKKFLREVAIALVETYETQRLDTKETNAKKMRTQ